MLFRKDKLIRLYVDPADPYDLALLFAMERLVSVLEGAHQKDVTIVAEKGAGRPKTANFTLHSKELSRAGTGITSHWGRFKAIRWTLKFIPKSMNIIGTQMADLAAYPIARRVLDRDKPNLAYDVVKVKLCRQLKIFP